MKEQKNYLTERPSTIKDWFLWAKEAGYDWADQAIKEFENDDDYEQNCEISCDSLREAIRLAFIWGYSENGYDYWDVIYGEVMLAEWHPIPEKEEVKTLSPAQQSTAEKIKVMHHFVDGGEVKSNKLEFGIWSGRWEDDISPCWDWYSKSYIIKEEDALIPTIPFPEWDGKAILLTPQVISALEKEGIKY